MSTVSGGSVGLFDYLRELDSATKGTQSDWKRMNSGSRCSSLEAVGRGLVYYDIPKAVVPLVPYFVSLHNGENDLLTEPLGKDRTGRCAAPWRGTSMIRSAPNGPTPARRSG